MFEGGAKVEVLNTTVMSEVDSPQPIAPKLESNKSVSSRSQNDSPKPGGMSDADILKLLNGSSKIPSSLRSVAPFLEEAHSILM